MKLVGVLILVTIFIQNDAAVRKPTSDDRVQRTAVDLARLIHLVTNYRQGDEEKDFDDDRADNSSIQSFDLDYYIVRTEEPQVQENLEPSHQDFHGPGVRLHIINNPKVLEEFKKRNQAKPKSSISTEGHHRDSIFYKNLYNKHQRRNAVFRLDRSSRERALRTKTEDRSLSKNLRESSELRNKLVTSRNNNKYHNNDAANRKRGTKDSLEQDNAWDVITKRYGEERTEYTKKKGRQIRKKVADDDSDKVTKQIIESWAKNRRPDEPERNHKTDNRPKRYESRETKPKIKKDYDNSYESPKASKYESRESKKVKKDYDKSYEKPKRKKKDDISDYDATPFEITTRNWKSKLNANRNKAQVPKIESYYSNPKPKQSRDNYDSGGGNGGFFGRTPIPYVGRHGIYEKEE